MPLTTARVLVVENDPLVSEIIADMIVEAGGRVVGPFVSVADALERLTDLGGVDIAILDVNLADETCYPLAAALQATQIPFVFLTGMHRDNIAGDFAAAGYLQKPFTSADLVGALVRHGDKHLRR